MSVKNVWRVHNGSRPYLGRAHSSRSVARTREGLGVPLYRAPRLTQSPLPFFFSFLFS